jgi:hypothetical protein
MFQSPLSCGPIESRAIHLVQSGDFGNKGIPWVRIRQKTADTEKDLGDGECGAPLVLENVQTDPALCVDVRVIDLGNELDPRSLEGIVCGELNVKKEDTSCVWAPVGSYDGGSPNVEVVLVYGRCGAVTGGILLKFLQITGNTTMRHKNMFCVAGRSVFVLGFRFGMRVGLHHLAQTAFDTREPREEGMLGAEF